MRLVFAKGKQRDFLLDFKKATALSWDKISELVGFSSRTVNDWRKEKTTLPEAVFEFFLRINSDLDRYSKFILEKKPNNWGQKKGAELANKIQGIKIKYPRRKSWRLAELIGIILGDGNLYSNQNKGIYELRIFGHSIDDREYLLDYVRPLIEELFNVEPKIVKYKHAKCFCLKVQSRRLIDYFKFKHLLSPGNKIENQSKIPEWVFSKNSYMRACVRGLLDTDGCIYPLKPHYPNLYQISFKSHNDVLLNQTISIFKKLGFNPSKISYHKTYLTRKSDIKKFLREIAFSNPKHTRKVSPVV